MRGYALLLSSSLLAGTAVAEVSSRFTLVTTVQATPSGNYLGGGFVRINYVPGRDRFILTFNTKLNQAEGGCTDVAFAYEEFTADLGKTGQAGVVSCHAMTDTGSLLVGNDFYLASMERQAGETGWQLARYDAVTWATKASFFYPLTAYPREGEADPMLAWVNGRLDISSQYNDNPTGAPPPVLTQGAATHHQFFTADLQFVEKRVLSDTPHVNMDSMIFVGGTYHFLASSAYIGDLVVMRYDQSWNFLGAKTLKANVHAPEGVAFDGSRFFVAYVDTSQRGGPASFPLYQNIRLAAFDLSWNLLEDIAVTSFAPEDHKQPDRPWLALRGNRLYLSWDQDTVDPATGSEELKGQAFVRLYELSTETTSCTSFTISPTSASPAAAAGSQSVTVTGWPSGCSGGSWTASGNGSWLTVSPAGGTGAGSVTVSWTQNTSTARAGSATIAGNGFAVTQSAPPSAVPQVVTLSSGRVSVTVDWRNPYSLQSGRAYAIPMADQYGFFYYTDPANPEVFVKVLDFGSGGALVFVGGLTDFYYKVTFTVLRTGQTLVFEKPPYQFVGHVDNGTLRF